MKVSRQHILCYNVPVELIRHVANVISKDVVVYFFFW